MFSTNVSTRITFNFIYWVFSECLRHERQVEAEDAKKEHWSITDLYITGWRKPYSFVWRQVTPAEVQNRHIV